MSKLYKANFADFSGGLVTNQFNSSLNHNEFTELENVDYLVRGGFIKRFGYTDIVPTEQSLLDLGIEQVDIDAWFDETNFNGIKQSITKIYAKVYSKDSDGVIHNPTVTDDDFEIIVCAINGKLVVMNYIEPTAENKLTHSDGNPTIYPSRVLYSGFQNANVFKLGQGLNYNLIATPGDNILIGKLILNETNNTIDFEVETLNSIKKVPTVTEYNVLGGNALADDIYNDVQDQLNAQSFAVVNVRTRPNTGFIDNKTILTAYLTVPTSDIENYEFRWFAKKPGESDYTEVKIWTVGASGKTLEYTPTTILKADGSSAGELNFAYYAFKVEAREIAVPSNTTELEIMQYKVTDVNKNRTENTSQADINKCIDFEISDDRIKFYNNGTPLWYKSFIKDETYIPVNGIMNFDKVKTENVTGVVSYRSGKLVFTETTIYAVRGKGDDIEDIGGNYSPYLAEVVSTDRGCIAPNSIAVADNIVFFLSNNGIYGLDTLSVDQSRIQLDKVSDNIDNITYRDTNAVGIVYNNKYYLFYPNRSFAIKLDFIYGRAVTQANIPTKPFTIDKSDKINFHYIAIIDDRLIGLSKNDELLEQNVISLPIDTDINRLEDIVFADGFFKDDGEDYLQRVVSKNYNSFVEQSGTQQTTNKRVKKVYVNSQNYSKEDTKFYFELFSEYGKIVDTTEIVDTIEEILGERQIVRQINKVPNVINKTGFKLGTSGQSILGTSELGFYENSVSFVKIKKSKISKNFKFVFENDSDQPSVITAFGAYYILYGDKE